MRTSNEIVEHCANLEAMFVAEQPLLTIAEAELVVEADVWVVVVIEAVDNVIGGVDVSGVVVVTGAEMLHMIGPP